MAGQLGNQITTIRKLKIIQINSEKNILVIKGSVPGKPGNLLSIVPSGPSHSLEIKNIEKEG